MDMPVAFDIQRRVGEELLARGWHAKSIAVASRPGSAWILTDPGRRVKVRMSADFAAPRAEFTAVYFFSSQPTAPQWRAVIDFAPAPAILAVALAAAATGDGGGSAADRRAVARALAALGLLPDRDRPTRALSGVTTWRSPDRRGTVTWTAPTRRRDGGWRISGPLLRMDADAAIPATVLTAAISASAFGRTESTP